MRCPYCMSENTSVIDTRYVVDDNSVRRRRICNNCNKRFTTYEKISLSDITVIKKDSTRESFDRSKVLAGIMKACEKRPISREKMESIANKVEQRIRRSGSKEIKSSKIGDMVIKELLKVDPIAYIRFASVYKNFDSVEDFNEIVKMLKSARNKRVRK
ncbi:MAG: transcriptional regulator NrdR [Candidatus Micrarchaeia archaeon]